MDDVGGGERSPRAPLGAILALARADDPRGDAFTAAATFVVGTLTLLAGLVGLYQDAPVVPLTWHLALLAGGCLLILVKRSGPVRALVGGLTLLALDLLWGGSLALVLVLWDLLYAVALWASATARRILWATASTLAAGGAVAAAVAAGDVRLLVTMALQLGGILLMPLWWATSVRQKAELAALERRRADLAAQRARLAEREASLERERAQDLARLADASRHEAVQAERTAMARDLHDVVAAQLSAIALHTGAALAGPPDVARDRAALEQARASSVASLGEMRSMILLLRSDPGSRDEPVAAPARLTGPGALAELVRRARDSGTTVRTEDPDDVVGGGLPAAVDQALHRIVAEGLTNAAKHAPGSAARLRLARHAEVVEAHLVNGAPVSPGPTCDAALSGGAGLPGMRERAAALGGTLTAGPQADGGWAITARLPIHPPSAASTS